MNLTSVSLIIYLQSIADLMFLGVDQLQLSSSQHSFFPPSSHPASHHGLTTPIYFLEWCCQTAVPKQTCITRQLEGKWVMWENSCSWACWRVPKPYVHTYRVSSVFSAIVLSHWWILVHTGAFVIALWTCAVSRCSADVVLLRLLTLREQIDTTFKLVHKYLLHWAFPSITFDKNDSNTVHL